MSMVTRGPCGGSLQPFTLRFGWSSDSNTQ